jgi:hypothetical protein
MILTFYRDDPAALSSDETCNSVSSSLHVYASVGPAVKLLDLAEVATDFRVKTECLFGPQKLYREGACVAVTEENTIGKPTGNTVSSDDLPGKYCFTTIRTQAEPVALVNRPARIMLRQDDSRSGNLIPPDPIHSSGESE